MKNRKRYFIIFYTAVSNNGSQVFGEASSHTMGNYISKSEFINYMKESKNYKDLVITNILEVCKGDFEYYYGRT